MEMPRFEAAAKRRLAGQPRRGRSAVSPRKPTAVDRHVGRRLRLLRQINEMSLEKLAEIVDVAPQQIQKYEMGETRISASRIYELSKIFDVPLAWFYDDLAASTAAEMDARLKQFETVADVTKCSTTTASHEDLLATYTALLTPEMRLKLVDFARMLSEIAVSKQAK
jgi:transcriptional regulator with XRE-family HTH domain